MTTRPDSQQPFAAPGADSASVPPTEGPDPVRLAELAARAHELAGSEGIPEAFQALADRLPGATSGSAMYGFGARVSLAIGDLAAALDAAAARASAEPDPPSREPPAPDPAERADHARP